MVNFIKRDKNDIFNKPILGFFFKNPKFLLSLRIIVLALFLYAVYYGFANPSKENIFTGAVFWGLFWALFMVSTLPTFGRIFCGICPHGFIGKYITAFGLKRSIPKWLQNRYIGIFLLVIGWWGVYYTFSGFWKSPLATAGMFAGMTAVAIVFYYIYKDMSYCKYICPIGSMCRAYDKLSFTKLETYTDTCKSCRTFECAKACPYDLKPFTFSHKNSMDDCTLCMECANSCEAVKFKFTKPSHKLFDKFKTLKEEIWVYILILASIPVTMTFAHGLDRSSIADTMIWNQTARFLGLGEYGGMFAFIYAILLTSFFAVIGLYLASKVLKKEYSQTFTTLGYAYAPLFILGSLGHTLETFFIKDYQTIIQGFGQAFGIAVEVSPLAKRGDAWLNYLGLLKWLGIIWTLILLYIRLKLIESTKIRKIFAYIFASLLVIFFIGINSYRGYVLSKYPPTKNGSHSSHSHHGGGNKDMFQSVSFKEATLVQEGKNKTSGIVCGMNLPQFYKTNHTATLDGKARQYCSIHCLCEDLMINKLPLENIQVVDVKSLKFIDAKSAFYVVGSNKPATMSSVSKYAFKDKSDAIEFIKQNGGELINFDQALEVAFKDFEPTAKTSMINDNEPIFFTLEDPSKSKSDRSSGGGMHSHGGGSGNPKAIPTKKVWLAFGDINTPNPLSIDVKSFYYDSNKELKDLNKDKKSGAFAFEIQNNGYYTLFATNEIVNNDILYHKTAKIEHLQGSHGNTDKYSDKDKEILFAKEPKIDLVRLRGEQEDSFFYKNYSGEELRFQAFLDGNPLANAKIKITLDTGWIRELKTDKDGFVTFNIIKDYFPNWSEFDKRHKQSLLITMEYERDSLSDAYYQEKFILTYPMTFYPGEDEYKSYAYGLAITLAFMIFSTLLVYFYRQKRTKCYQEIENDE
ncbi:MAG: nitrous oxide reductase accessory protein NosL [Campylobacterota bacterium]